jgi:hypothetical protein
MLRDRKNARNDIIARLPKRSHTSETQSQMGVSYIHKELPMVFYDMFNSYVELRLHRMRDLEYLQSRIYERESLHPVLYDEKPFYGQQNMYT